MSKNASRVVAYLPSLRTFLHRLRATCQTPSTLAPTLLATSPSSNTAIAFVDKRDILSTMPDLHLSTGVSEAVGVSHLGLNPSFSLPGATGLMKEDDDGIATDDDITSICNELQDNYSSSLSDDKAVECNLRECPSFLHDQFMELFPGINLPVGQLRILTLCEQTSNDMTSWSQPVDEEREELLGHFIDSAKEICSRLMGAGYWADFVDPSSGRAFYSQYSHNYLFETDDKFCYLGFDIIDLGCCKCISHPVWGTHTFVGTVFTDAPINSTPLQIIINL